MTERFDGRDFSSGGPGYDPRLLDRSVVSIPLQDQIRSRIEAKDLSPIPLVIDLNLDFRPNRSAAMEDTLRLIREILFFEPKGRGTQPAVALDYLNQVVHRRSVVFLISDFQAPGTGGITHLN